MNDAIAHLKAFKAAKARGGARSRFDWIADITLLQRLMHALDTVLNSIGATDRLISTMAKFMEVSRAVVALSTKEMSQAQAREYEQCLESHIQFYKTSILYLRQLFRL